MVTDGSKSCRGRPGHRWEVEWGECVMKSLCREWPTKERNDNETSQFLLMAQLKQTK